MATYDNSKATIKIIGTLNEKKTFGENPILEAFRIGVLDSYDAPVGNALIEQKDQRFIAHIANRETYSFETVQFDFSNNRISNVVRNFNMKGESSYIMESKEEITDYSNYDFFIATPVPEISTAKKMVEDIKRYAIANGYKPYLAEGSAASIQLYQSAFIANLKGFVSVGHGSTTGLMLANGVLSYSWFNRLYNRGLSPEVITLNSCQVFNDPFKSSILNHGARTFIGGITNLRIGSSELVTAGFWNTELYTPSALMGRTLATQSTAQPTAGTFGIGGDTGKFT